MTRTYFLFLVLLFLALPSLLPLPIEEPVVVPTTTPVPVLHSREEAIEYATKMAAFREVGFITIEVNDSLALRNALYERVEPVVIRWVAPQVEPWRPLVEKYFPAEQVDNALRVMLCESTGDPSIVSHTDDWGLFQHHLRFWKERSTEAGWANANVLDPEANVAVAAWLWSSRGSWRDWVCAKKLGIYG